MTFATITAPLRAGTACMLLGMSGVLAAQEAAKAPNDLAKTAQIFGSRETVRDISLSPSGNKIVYVSAGPGSSEVLTVINLAGDAKPRVITVNNEVQSDLDQCEWATETRIVCQVSGISRNDDGILVPYDRMFAIEDDGSNPKVLTVRQSALALQALQFGGDVIALDVAGEPGKVLLTRSYVPENTSGSRLASAAEGLGIDLVDATTGKRDVFETPDKMASRYVADASGRVRIKKRSLLDGNGILTGKELYFYRAPDSDSWKPFENLTIDGQPAGSFAPVSVDSIRNVAYGFIDKDGYGAIAEFPLDGSGAGKILLARGDVDVDTLLRIGRQRRAVGASYATEKRAIAYFDPALAKIAADLGKALPGKPVVNIVGASADENRLLLIASSDTQPGMVYLFDKQARTLEPLIDVRANLANVPLGKMQAVTYPAADGTQIPAYLTLPPGSDGKGLPAVVLPHGGPAARDEWGFDWIVQFLTARGYAVLQPNYRGSAGYGEAWYGRNGFKAWDVAIGDVNDAGRWLVSQGIAQPDKLAVAGWSYGGYAALQSQVTDPTLFKAVVAIAPVTDLNYLVEDAGAYTTSRLVRDFVGTGDHVNAGSPRRFASRFAAPVALFHGTLDLNVEVRHSRGMEAALKAEGKSVLYREYPDLQHDLGDSAVRAAMLTEIGQFLDAALGQK